MTGERATRWCSRSRSANWARSGTVPKSDTSAKSRATAGRTRSSRGQLSTRTTRRVAPIERHILELRLEVILHLVGPCWKDELGVEELLWSDISLATQVVVVAEASISWIVGAGKNVVVHLRPGLEAGFVESGNGSDFSPALSFEECLKSVSVETC
jgi:hypothetical protein